MSPKVTPASQVKVCKKNSSKITVEKVRKYLKCNGLTKYYPYCTAFCMDLQQRIEISSETYEKCWVTLGQFVSCTREDKGNRMNFTYVVYKLIELYGNEKEKTNLESTFICSLQQLKEIHEKSWREICKRLNLE